METLPSRQLKPAQMQFIYKFNFEPKYTTVGYPVTFRKCKILFWNIKKSREKETIEQQIVHIDSEDNFVTSKLLPLIAENKYLVYEQALLQLNASAMLFL